VISHGNLTKLSDQDYNFYFPLNASVLAKKCSQLFLLKPDGFIFEPYINFEVAIGHPDVYPVAIFPL